MKPIRMGPVPHDNERIESLFGAAGDGHIPNATPGKRIYAVSCPTDVDRAKRAPEAKNDSTITMRYRKEKIPMDAQHIVDSDEFRRCADFHGHICPGLSIGYKAAKVAMERLGELGSDDEEIVAVVENDACFADAVQVLTGCTFGKGNFIYKDHGKMVLTLASRKTGQGVRVAMRPGAFSPDETHLALLQKVMKGEADEKEKKRFHALHFQRSCDVLKMPGDEFFVVKEVQKELPARAKIEPSEPCTQCGESTMRTKLETVDNRRLCRDCIEQCMC